MHKTDVAIIGAGPVGLFAVFECGMVRLKCHVIDALDMTGGQCTALYPEKPIYDIPGFPQVMAADLIKNLEQQVAPFAPTFHLGQQVQKLTRVGDGWQIETSKGTKIECKTIIIAAGCGAFGPNRPPLEGIEKYEGKSVHYMVRAREDFRGRRIVIAGGGDSALDWAISLHDIAAKIYMVHRRDKFRGAPESVARLKQLTDAGKIELVVPYQLSALEGANGQISNVILETLDGQKRKLEADCLLPFFGLSMELGPIANWGLNLDHNYIAVDPATAATNQPGIFAIGDIAKYAGKLKLILTGFAEGAIAAHAAYKIINPNQELHFEYSTTKGVPGADKAA
ncbi:MAG: NAD(P)/FAD-dependent oxidoreductase [Alphaproteobacteria bacterium]|nr:MAG: NAD(P)/FAD-dependent oxidoreductase [Alphaproteobacteria bacterium]